MEYTQPSIAATCNIQHSTVAIALPFHFVEFTIPFLRAVVCCRFRSRCFFFRHLYFAFDCLCYSCSCTSTFHATPLQCSTRCLLQLRVAKRCRVGCMKCKSKISLPLKFTQYLQPQWCRADVNGTASPPSHFRAAQRCRPHVRPHEAIAAALIFVYS